MDRNTKAVFIDVDGTLTDDISAWEKVHAQFDCEKEMEHNSALYFSGKISYEQWAEMDVIHWKGKSLEDYKLALKDPILRKGAKEGIQTLKKSGFDVVLVSGGLSEMVKNVAEVVNADHFIANSIGHANGTLDGTVDIQVGNSKSEVIKQYARTRNYQLDACGAIGDNVNDIDMFKLVGYSVAINTDKQIVIDAADSKIDSDDFSVAVNEILSNLAN